MGEIPNKLFGGASEIFFVPLGEEEMQKLDSVITDSTMILSTEEVIEFSDRFEISKATQFEPFNIEPISCSFDLADGDWKTILGIRDDNGQPKICSLTIIGESYIHRPKNIKYPNKKRARRIWKKWAKRYGVTPAPTISIPNAEISCEMAKNGAFYNVTAKPINNGKENH